MSAVAAQIDDGFALFGLPRRFSLDGEALAQAWRAMQARVHPDRFATAPAGDRRAAAQMSMRLNDAYRTLRSPMLRAAHLCELTGVPVNAETHTAIDGGFLMMQLQWREALEEAARAGDKAALHRLAAEVVQARDAAHRQLVDLLDVRRAYAEAAVRVRELMFIERFGDELAAAQERAATAS